MLGKMCRQGPSYSDLLFAIKCFSVRYRVGLKNDPTLPINKANKHFLYLRQPLEHSRKASLASHDNCSLCCLHNQWCYLYSCEQSFSILLTLYFVILLASFSCFVSFFSSLSFLFLFRI